MSSASIGCGFEKGSTCWLDTFDKKALAHSVISQRGSDTPYYRCFEELIKQLDKREEQASQVELYTNLP